MHTCICMSVEALLSGETNVRYNLGEMEIGTSMANDLPPELLDYWGTGDRTLLKGCVSIDWWRENAYVGEQ